jgi:uncharacterized damage-inducible protein DinB
MIDTQIFRTFSRYNQWMNGKLLDACALLTDEERKRPMGAPFSSIHGLWNHLLVTDRLWLARFDGTPLPYQSLKDQISDDFEELRRERLRTDAEIEAYVQALTPEKLAGTLKITPISNPTPFTLPFYAGMMQLFNHQTHHRGQITVLLEQLGGDCGVTDIGGMPELRV